MIYHNVGMMNEVTAVKIWHAQYLLHDGSVKTIFELPSVAYKYVLPPTHTHTKIGLLTLRGLTGTEARGKSILKLSKNIILTFRWWFRYH